MEAKHEFVLEFFLQITAANPTRIQRTREKKETKNTKTRI